MADKITYLPVAKRPHDQVLQRVPDDARGCQHWDGPFYYDERLSEVSCACGAKLNPIWVVAQLGRQGSRWRAEREAFVKAKAEHDKRRRCKCQHCGQMTPIRGI